MSSRKRLREVDLQLHEQFLEACAPEASEPDPVVRKRRRERRRLTHWLKDVEEVPQVPDFVAHHTLVAPLTFAVTAPSRSPYSVIVVD